jgi:hypothetical protein
VVRERRSSERRHNARFGHWRVCWGDRKSAIYLARLSSEIGLEAILRQVGDCNHYEFVPVAEPDKVGHACHRAIVIGNLADHAGGGESRETGQIDRSLRMTTTL